MATRDAVNEVMESFGEFKRIYDDRHEQLQRQIDEAHKRLNRPGGFGSGDATGAADAELVAAFRQFAATGDDSKLRARVNTMSTSSDPDGGYLVYPERSTGWTKKIFETSPLRRLARIETITTGDGFEEPIDCDDIEAQWVGEAEGRPAGATPELKMVRIACNETYALQPITQRLIDDADRDLLAWLGDKIGDKFGRQEGAAFVSGNGVNKPRGFLTQDISNAPDATRPWFTLQYAPSGSASAVMADGLRDLVWALRAPYRQGAVWLMNSNTASRIDKLKNLNDDYIWRDSSAAGVPPTLLGYAVEFDENMPDVAADAYPIAFGNFRMAYIIVDKLGTRFLRDPYSDKPRVLIYAYRRVGGGLANSEALKLLKIATS